jgi:hypothetical protein
MDHLPSSELERLPVSESDLLSRYELEPLPSSDQDRLHSSTLKRLPNSKMTFPCPIWSVPTLCLKLALPQFLRSPILSSSCLLNV